MSVKNALDSFAFDVIEGAKRNLKRKNKNTSKKLSNSLDYKLKISAKKDKFSLPFLMEDYGEFLDQGVKGVGGTKADGTKWKKKRVSPKSPFKYRSKKPPSSAFSNWIVRRGIAPRNAQGQFVSRKSLQFAIANSVYHTGIETTNFFTQPFEKEFKNLSNAVTQAFADEAELTLKFVIK
jgi:hypothetical protein